jgi:hypothetical protein
MNEDLKFRILFVVLSPIWFPLWLFFVLPYGLMDLPYVVALWRRKDPMWRHYLRQVCDNASAPPIFGLEAWVWVIMLPIWPLVLPCIPYQCLKALIFPQRFLTVRP